MVINHQTVLYMNCNRGIRNVFELYHIAHGGLSIGAGELKDNNRWVYYAFIEWSSLRFKSYISRKKPLPSCCRGCLYVQAQTLCCRCIKMKRKKAQNTTKISLMHMISLFVFLSFFFYFYHSHHPHFLIKRKSWKPQVLSQSEVVHDKSSLWKVIAVIIGSEYISLHSKTAFGSINLDIYLKIIIIILGVF